MCELSYIKNIQDLTVQSVHRTHLIDSLLQVLQQHNSYTVAHNQRVGQISYCLASALELPDDQVSIIRESGHLHDIGKLFIPLSSICKTASLNDLEYQEMQTHPEKGVEILRRFEGLQNLVDGVLYHHERFDGLGYPYRLQGEEIPLSARIIAIADTFDAMTSHRSYRPALSVNEALSEIKAVAGTQLDPFLVEVALSLDLSVFVSS